MLTYDTGVAWLPPIAVAVSILGATLLLVIGRVVPRLVADLTATAVAAAVTGLCATVLAASASGRVVTWAADWIPHHGFSVGIVLVSDPVGAGIAMLAAALATCALLYSWRYFESAEGHFQALMLLFLAGMTGFAFTGDLFDMFVFFELMGASAYALTGMHVEDPTALQGALNFGIVNSLGAYLSLAGLGMLYARTGNLGLPQLGAALAHHHPDALVVAAFVLVVTGFLVKAAMVPFHFWLADAHAVAPPPVCVLFSGVMVPLGVYAALRVYWVVFSATLAVPDLRRTFLVMGVITALLGAVMSVGQRHIKRLLAYSTIGHVGLFLCALAMLNPAGTAGALLYVAGHAGAKSALFLLAGVVLNRYGSVDEHRLYGRGRRARLMPWLWVAGGLALAAMPPFGTGLGKAVSEDAGLASGYPFVPAVFVAVSALTGGAVLRVTGRVFFGLGPPPPVDEGDVSTGKEKSDTKLARVPLTMLIPIVVLLGGCLAEGLIPGAYAAALHAGEYFTQPTGYIGAALHRVGGDARAPRPGNWTALGLILGFTSALLAGGVAAVGLYGAPLAARFAALTGPAGAAFAGLRRVHSGHVGDYVAWLFTGIVVLAALVGLPILTR
ncbi:MAG: complex I subunit 5 family protein [Mycobacteriales bacterium]